MNRNLWKKYKYSTKHGQNIPAPLTIGIVGAGRGVGATHIAILLARHLRMDYGGRVTVVECNSHREYQWMSKASEEGISAFTLYGIDFYARAEADSVFSGKINEADYRILDYGEEWMSHKDSLDQCGLRILVGSTSPWKRRIFEQMVKLLKEEGRWYFLYNLQGAKIQGKLGKNSYTVGFDALEEAPKEATCLAFDEILERGAACTRKNTG